MLLRGSGMIHSSVPITPIPWRWIIPEYPRSQWSDHNPWPDSSFWLVHFALNEKPKLHKGSCGWGKSLIIHFPLLSLWFSPQARVSGCQFSANQLMAVAEVSRQRGLTYALAEEQTREINAIFL
jgi:hypothetical protein